MTSTPASTPTTTTPGDRIVEWCNSHCYHCGRTLEHIAEFGPTAGCLCDPGDPTDPPLSDLEFEALDRDGEAFNHGTTR